MLVNLIKNLCKYLILLSFFLSSVSCTKELFDLSLEKSHTPKIVPFDDTYSLILKRTNEEIGQVKHKVKYYQTRRGLFYQSYYNLILDWRKENYTDVDRLRIKSRAVIDSHFKLRSFNGTLTENKQISYRKGYYKKPYFYLTENGKESRIRATNGIFSNLVERYLMTYELIEPGDAVVYHYLNLVNLSVEEERLFFEKRDHLNIATQEVSVNMFISNNYTLNYYTTYWFDSNAKLVQKSDFREALLWKLQ